MGRLQNFNHEINETKKSRAVALLEVRDLEVRYGRVTALGSISLQIRRGELVSLIGLNGAGKSTILNAIVGRVRPTRGSVTFGGRFVVGQSPEKMVRSGVAMVPEGREVFVKLKVSENLHLGGVSLKDRSTFPDDMEAMLELFPDLRRAYNVPAGRLSGGQQQQLSIARALLSKPRLLLLDEPSLGLAPVVVDAIFDTLLDLRAQGMTILLAEQNASKAVSLADRTYVIRTGEVVYSGSRESLLDDDFVASLLGV